MIPAAVALVVSATMAFAPPVATGRAAGFALFLGTAALIQVAWALVSGHRRIVGWAGATLTATFGVSLIGAQETGWTPALFTIGLVVFVETALWAIDARDPEKPVSAHTRSDWKLIAVLGSTIGATAIIREVDYPFQPGILVHTAAVGAAVAALSVVVVLIRRGT